MNYDWDFGVLFNAASLALLIKGFGVTLALTAWAIAIGTPLGLVVGTIASWGRVAGFESRHSGVSGKTTRIMVMIARVGALLYIDLIRAIPLPLLILLSYYGLPVAARTLSVSLIPSHHTTGAELSAFSTSVVALAINMSAFVADLVRGSAVAVSKGSVLAARTLGMGSWLTWRRIILPEVIREMLPGFTLLSITIWKLSTLCSIVAVYEVMHTADAIIQRTYKPLEIYFVVALLFVITVVPVTALARRMEGTQAFLRRTV